MSFTTERRELATDRRSTTSEPTVESLRAALSDAAKIRAEQQAEIIALRMALSRALDRAAAVEQQRAAA
jgi:hypothetical protein